MHELAHLIEFNHGPAFDAIVARYPKAERARGYLIAKDLDDDQVDDDVRALPIEIVTLDDADSDRARITPGDVVRSHVGVHASIAHDTSGSSR